MSPEQIDRILKIISRAPSPHNTQPLKWSFSNDKIELYAVRDRILWTSDKELRDLHLSAGAGFQLLKLALEKEGLSIGDVKFHKPQFKTAEELYLVCSVISSPAVTSPDLILLEKHACYRGPFKNDDSAFSPSTPNSTVISGKEAKKKIATLYDQASAFFLSQRPYAEELWHWLRLDKADPRFYQDGLNAEMLRLNGFLTWPSRIIMRPGVLNVLGKLKSLATIVTEASQNTSCEGFALIQRDISKTLFEQGQDLMKLWFEIERAGRVLCPVTALIDDPKFEKELRTIAHAKNEIIHVVRFGKKPEKETLGLSPRLDLKKILKEF